MSGLRAFGGEVDAVFLDVGGVFHLPATDIIGAALLRVGVDPVDPELLDRFPDQRPSADEVLDRQQLLEHLDAAVATLSASDRLLLALRHQDGRSARGIATLMSLPTPFHVYRRLNRVHTALRQALAARSDRPPRVQSAAPDPSAVQYQWRSDGPLEPSQ